MIASSPVRMQDHQTAGVGLLQASAVQIQHQYIVHQPNTQQSSAQNVQPWSATCSTLSEYPMHHPGPSNAIPASAARSSSASSSSISPTSIPPTDHDSDPVLFQKMMDAYSGCPPSTTTTNNMDDIDDIDDMMIDDEEDVGTAAALSLFPDDDDTVVSLDEPYGGSRVRRGHQRNRHGSLNSSALLTAVASRAHSHFATVQASLHQSRNQPLMLRRSPSGSMVDGGGHTNGLMSVMSSGSHLICTDARC